MEKDTIRVNWAKICSPINNGGLKIINLYNGNNVYLFKFTWNFAYNNTHLSILLKAIVLKLK